MILINKGLTIDEAIKVIRYDEEIEFSEKAIKRVQDGSKLIDEALQKKIPIYGVTTGVGANSARGIGMDGARDYQEKLLRSHAVSVGDPISYEHQRAIMLMVILNGLSGYSGVTIETLNTYKEALNKKLYLFVPGSGSVGYLSLEGHIGLALLGEGKIMKDGQWVDSSIVLKEVGLKHLELSHKEGLFLISGTTSVTAYGATAIYDIETLIKTFELVSAMSVEVNGATVSSFDDKLMQVRKQVEQSQVASVIRDILEGSEVFKEYSHKDPQSALSFRCIPQLVGPVKKKFHEAKLTVEREMKSSTDNPILLKENDEILVLFGCNADSSYIGLEMDCLSIALCMLAKMSDRRIFRMLDENLSGNPPFLVRHAGANSGLMITQYTTAGLLNEMKINATPGIIDCIPTCANQEDYVSMGFNSSVKVHKQIKNLSYIIAIELLTIFQANEYVDKNLKRSPKTQKVYDYLSEYIPILENDIKLYDIIERLNKDILDRKIINLI